MAADAMLISNVSDDLCLAYANTLTWRGSDAPSESLTGWDELMAWLEKSAGIGASALHETTAWLHAHPKKADTLFADMIGMRETIFRVFSAFATEEAPRDKDFAALSAALAEAPQRHALVRANGRYAWRLERLKPAMPDLLAPVLWSAGDLILNAGQRRIRRCANEKCLWLFFDESKSGTRRWCDMSACGNRAKAKRHYAKVSGR
ncbi:MAG: CGNR zinc finger domain-containing protein [Variibacter sp.]